MAYLIIAYIIRAQAFMADRVSEPVDSAYNVMTYIVMTYTVVAYVVMACKGMIRVVIANQASEPNNGTCIVMANVVWTV